MHSGLTVEITWQQIAIRLAFACLASLLLGYNRDEHGRPAGMRTVMLVMLAATLAMLQVNLLLPLRGKASDSFNVLDLMRLPLGILSGIGFIGAGAIIKKESGAIGVTTAATIWFATVLGLLFGGGQIILASASTVLALIILSGLRYVENWLPRAHRGSLLLTFEAGDRTGVSAETEDSISAQIRKLPAEVHDLAVDYAPHGRLLSFRCGIKWHSSPRHASHIPSSLDSLKALPSLRRFHWEQED